ncbi:GntR family transcriptional regulator [Companilactobacillus halodurans]|uniref:UTRA domain-containing protein n=1 Tax=Companilactobacillus halodurans TaxID=2584183 RepID=A0A5P0ZTV8_9LACO|nr:UTRA domain-containing protein [Companilactobacillus halodurans]MQS96447.1 UTRA domain-containing protein [Companilactobacillus halodurans]
MVNKESIIPLYEQVKNEIIKKISNGIYEVGSKIPAEHELEKEFNTSRITIRRAVDELVDENYLTKKQGKGTFVNIHKVKRNLLSLNSYTNFMLRNHIAPSIKVVDLNFVKANSKIAHNLGIEKDEAVLKVERVMHFEKNNEGYEIAYYDVSKYPDLKTKISDKTSISNLLRNDYRVFENRSHQIINVTFATKKVAQLIHVNLGIPLYQLERIAYDDQDIPIYYSVMYYDPNKVSFTVDSK